MKLKPLQLLWMRGGLAFFIAVILDIAGAIEFPHTLMLVCSSLLLFLSWKVGPSLAEVRKANRRG